MWSIFQSLFRNPAIRPVPLGDDLVLVSEDRDNFFVSKGGKVAQVYAPCGSWFGRRRDFHGVVSERWNSPYHDQAIAPEDKRMIENALLKYLRESGCEPVWMVQDPNEPVLQVKM